MRSIWSPLFFVKLGYEWKQGHSAFIQGIEGIKPDPSNLPLPVAAICGLPTWTAAQGSLSFTIFWSLLRFMSTESMMPSIHLILCHPFLLLPSILPSIGSFPMSPLKLQYFSHLMRRADSVDMNLSKLQKIVKDSEACVAVHGVAKSRTSLSNWTTATMVNEDGKADGLREMCKRGCKGWRLKSWREYSQWSSCRSKRLRKSPPRH